MARRTLWLIISVSVTCILAHIGKTSQISGSSVLQVQEKVSPDLISAQLIRCLGNWVYISTPETIGLENRRVFIPFAVSALSPRQRTFGNEKKSIFFVVS
jgi:hypothetical protein